MIKESTFGMKSQRAIGGGRWYGVPFGGRYFRCGEIGWHHEEIRPGAELILDSVSGTFCQEESNMTKGRFGIHGGPESYGRP